MIELQQRWKRASLLWKRFLAFWPRLIFLLTFLFASADLAFSVVIWIQCPRCGHRWMQTPGLANRTAASTEARPVATSSPAPSDSSPRTGLEPPPQEEPESAIQSTPSPEIPSSLKLMIPVAGIKPNQLRDTFSESRSEGRAHNAIDIMAARGTSVLAAADGKIIKLFTSERGGITIYQLSTDEKLVLYYAHLERYADGLSAGQMAKQGEVIGYVGDTGNAGSGNYHLHFALWNITDPKHYWDGVNINPYPLLRESR